MKYFMFLFLLLSNCKSENCTNFNNKTFKTYEDAVIFVKEANIKHFCEDLKNSSWMKEACFYSCDGLNGYFIYKTKENKSYIYRNLPIQVWNGFLISKSRGAYYNKKIKGRYKLELTN